MSLVLLAGSASVNTSAQLSNFDVELDAGQILLSFQLDNALDDDLRQRIESGLATDLAYDFRLVRQRRWWFDKNVDSGRLLVTTVYDSVTREYAINYMHDGDLIESRVVRNADELTGALTRFVRLPVFAIDDEAEGLLAVRMRAELGTRTRLFFIPTTHTTEWLESSRIAIAPGQSADVHSADVHSVGVQSAGD